MSCCFRPSAFVLLNVFLHDLLLFTLLILYAASRYTHVILLGGNDISHAVDAITRYSIARRLASEYQGNSLNVEPVKCTHVFGEDCCSLQGPCQPNFFPVVEVSLGRVRCWLPVISRSEDGACLWYIYEITDQIKVEWRSTYS